MEEGAVAAPVHGETGLRRHTKHHRRLRLEALSPRTLLTAAPWQNFDEPLDTNDDGHVTSFDLLIIANYVNLAGESPATPSPSTYPDVNGDQIVNGDDATLVFAALGGAIAFDPPLTSPPVAVDDVATVNEDEQVVIDVAFNDTDPDGDLDSTTVTVMEMPTSGETTVGFAGSVTYSPNPNYNGSDSFTYAVCDQQGNCDTAAVNITVEAMPDPIDKILAISGVVGLTIPPNEAAPNVTGLTLEIIQDDAIGFRAEPQDGAVFEDDEPVWTVLAPDGTTLDGGTGDEFTFTFDEFYAPSVRVSAKTPSTGDERVVDVKIVPYPKNVASTRFISDLPDGTYGGRFGYALTPSAHADPDDLIASASINGGARLRIREVVHKPADAYFELAEESLNLPGTISSDGHGNAEIVDTIGIAENRVDLNRFTYPDFPDVDHYQVVNQKLQWKSVAANSPRREIWNTFADQDHQKGLVKDGGFFSVHVSVNNISSLQPYDGPAVPPRNLSIASISPNPMVRARPGFSPASTVQITGQVFVSVAQAEAGSTSIGLELYDEDFLFYDDLLSHWTHIELLPAAARGGGYYQFDASTYLWNEFGFDLTVGPFSTVVGNAGANDEDGNTEVYAKATGTNVKTGATVVIVPLP